MDDYFDQKIKIDVFYYSTSQCSVCVSLKPKVIALTEEFNDVDFTYVDCEGNKEQCGQKMIFAVPTVIVFADDREVKRFSRVFSIDQVREVIERILPES